MFNVPFRLPASLAEFLGQSRRVTIENRMLVKLLGHASHVPVQLSYISYFGCSRNHVILREKENTQNASLNVLQM